MTDPALLKSQDGEVRPDLQFSMNDGSFAPGGGAQRPSGIALVRRLFYTVPGFWRLVAYQFCGSAGPLLPAIYYLGPLASQVWGDNAAAYSAWSNAVQFAVAMIGAPLFGTWSDGRPRKISMAILATCQIIRLAPLALFTGEGSLWGAVIIGGITAPFVPQISGSPVLWAWMTDMIPQEYRETGFSFLFAAGAVAAWLTGNVVSAVMIALSLRPQVYVWVGAFINVVGLLLVVTAPSQAPPAKTDDEDPDPLSRRRGFKDTVLSPFRLVVRKRTLRLICGMAAFVTLPDVAVTYVALPLVLVLLGIDGVGHDEEQASVAHWFLMFPAIFMVGIYAIVGICANRYGPARTLAIWTPITCVFFAAPALLSVYQGPVMQVICGLMMASPISIYPPLQALVAALVPPSRVGEAMGAVAGCKNLASLIAPLLMGVVTQTLANQGRLDLYWTLFPGAAILMLVGAWPFSLMLTRRVGSGHETDFDRSDWSSASGSAAHQHAMGS